MGLLNRQDAKIFRRYFNEMVKLIGQSVSYQWVVEQKMTIHSEDNSKLSMPVRLDIIFDENPSIDTLKALGWVSELNEQKPIIINVPYNTPKLSVNARFSIESVDGTARLRVFKVTKIQSDLEFPDAYTCAIVPVYDQYVQRNQYTLVNTEKISQDESSRTSKDQPYIYITNEHKIDNTPERNKEWENEYSLLNNKKSPYSG